MNTSRDDFAERIAETSYVEASANLDECVCGNERRLHVALSEQSTRPGVFAPDFGGVKNARCATFGRCK
jgi:hypothetical protein